ncbi:MAG: SNF2-related protein [Clostridiaceae bacterium]
MNINELQQVIFKTSSTVMRKAGEEIFKDKLVSNIKGKKIENKYSIYGNVVCDNLELRTYIKIDLTEKFLESVSCTCDQFKEISTHKKLFMCEHLTATCYKFIDSVKMKNNKKDKESKRIQPKKEKAVVGLDINIIHKVWKGVTSYEVQFKVVHKHKYLITDLNNFLDSFNNKENIFFNNTFSYNPREHVFLQNDIKIIDFIKDYNKNSKVNSIVGRNFKIPPDDLRKFLEFLGEKNILFKYNDIEYKSNVFNSDLPLNFTLKEEGEYFVLTTHKKLPIFLNSKKDVFLFNGELYLPSKNQIDKYNNLHEKFLEKDRILYKKTINNYYLLSTLLSSISKNITFSDGVKKYIVNSSILEFLIYKEEKDIYCTVSAIYNKEKISILDESKDKRHIIRDFKEEEKTKMKLEKFKFIKKGDKFKFIGNDEDIFDILIKREGGLHSLGKVILGKGMGAIKLYKTEDIELNFREVEEYINLEFSIGDVDANEVPDILEGYKSGNRFYKTKEGSFINFQNSETKNFFNLILMFGFDNKEKNIKIENNKGFFVSESLKNIDYKINTGIDLLKNIGDIFANLENKEIECPKELKAKLREYQVTGFKWFKALSNLGFGGILADEMGLGKTIQTLAFLLSEKNKKSLIITPTSLIFNWKNEIEKFAPSLKVGIAYMEREDKNILKQLEEYDVILTTYGTLKNNIDRYENIEFDFCIIDEAQNIKNPLTENAKIVKKINSKLRFALTGTPIENNLTELWSIFDFIMPGYLYSKEEFEKKFNSKNSHLETLKLLIKPFVLRRTKKEVIEELPDKIEKKVLIEMTSYQKSIYNQYIKVVKEKIKNNSQGKIEVFSYLTKLRQICLDPALIVEGYKGGSGKLKVSLEYIENQLSNGGKVLLFSQFTSVLKKLGATLEKRNIEYLYLDGSTPSNERIKLVNEFNTNDEINVFLISLKAGGTGLNLTSANMVIHFDPWWNPAVENQATDRAHRIGQRNVVEVIKLVSRETIEESIVMLQEHKKQLIGSILTEELGAGGGNKLTREELLQILGG